LTRDSSRSPARVKYTRDESPPTHYYAAMQQSTAPTALTNAEKRQLKATAQHLEPVAYVGKAGLTPPVLAGIEQVLATRELIKVRLDHERDERDLLAAQIAAITHSALIMQVGKVAVFYRRKPVIPA
jgi:RNA-binding protein